jgi:Flp pilus assembly pilin Flp
MVEYAIVAGLIAAVCALAVSIIGLRANGYFTDARDGFN